MGRTGLDVSERERGKIRTEKGKEKLEKVYLRRRVRDKKEMQRREIEKRVGVSDHFRKRRRCGRGGNGGVQYQRR